MRRRSGFTLVELLVAMALIVFVMVILSEAFAASIQAFRLLKAVGDMDAQLRSASTVLRSDLSADHFEGKRRMSDPSFLQEGPPREGFFRVWHGSIPNDLDQALTMPVTPPGRINRLSIAESFDGAGDQIPSFRAVDHILHFSVKRRGNNRRDFFQATFNQGYISPLLTAKTSNNYDSDVVSEYRESRYQDSGNTLTSQWAEVAYFLAPLGNPDPFFEVALGKDAPVPIPPGRPGIPLYGLYRRQLVVLPNELDATYGANQVTAYDNAGNPIYPNYADISCKWPNYPSAPPKTTPPVTLSFNSPGDLTIPERRFGALLTTAAGVPIPGGIPGGASPYPNDDPTPTGPNYVAPYANYPLINSLNPALSGADLLVGNVLSFEVRVLRAGGSRFVRLHDLDQDPTAPPIAARPNTIFTQPRGPRVYDTWSSARISYKETYKDAMMMDKPLVYDYRGWDGSALPGPSQDPVASASPNLRTIPLPIQIIAIQITLRIWDQKTEQARQISIIQEL